MHMKQVMYILDIEQGAADRQLAQAGSTEETYEALGKLAAIDSMRRTVRELAEV